MKFLVFDTETTGLPKSRHAEPEDTWQFPYVVQLSWLIFNTGNNKIETPIIVKTDDAAAEESCLVSPPKSLKINQLRL